jgi:hypothetical protein
MLEGKTMHNRGYRLHSWQSFPRLQQIDFYLTKYDESGQHESIATLGEDGITWSPLEYGSSGYSPTFFIPIDNAQKLMDSLWTAGIRPTDLADQRGLVAHLQDMRTIAFKKLGIDLPRG